MPSCPECDAPLRSDALACERCGARLGAGQGSQGRGQAARTLPYPGGPTGSQELRLEGSAAVAAAPEAGPARPSRPPAPSVAATETGRHAVLRAEGAARPTPSGQLAVKRPVLASTALRRDLAPAAPGPASARWAAAVAGLAGLALTLPVSGLRGFGLPVAGALLLVLALGVLPLPYAARASALATVAGSGLLVVTWHALLARMVSPAPLVLRIGVIVLAMALLYRGWHRASLLARALVALGIALCAGWVWMSGTLGAVLVLGSAVQSWLGPVLAVLLVLLLMLSLLAFMDSRTTGGCAVWAALLLGWYVAYGWVDLLALVWRRSGARPWSSALLGEQWVALASAPLFTVVLSAALAQLLAVANAAEPE